MQKNQTFTDIVFIILFFLEIMQVPSQNTALKDQLYAPFPTFSAISQWKLL